MSTVTPDTRPHARGEDHGRAKLTEAKVLEIRAALADKTIVKGKPKTTVKGLARQYGVTPKNIRQIRDGKYWSHI